MSRLSTDQVIDGKLMNGFDYEAQVWVLNGVYQDCGHPRSMGDDCCNAHKLAGQRVA